ncbi:Dabb family protein [Galbitalea soli]|uniref:Dabb family protein n=1 Tax=Galbitalea soli TaxID=1268042 RepID=A0A7C9PPS2_9MICO|nr:Dabb family protein [Galbitalea soli]NEM92351.1 Dabb family protein [Galbitalea soli]NYJ31692.1 hypothetical protein [Galbitalea soli]
MIVHLASFTWTPEVTAADVAGLTESLTAMAAAVPELRYYQCGENVRLRPGGADYGVLALVDDQAGLDAYLDSEAHKQVYADWLSWMIDTRHAVQLESDGLSVARSEQPEN